MELSHKIPRDIARQDARDFITAVKEKMMAQPQAVNGLSNCNDLFNVKHRFSDGIYIRECSILGISLSWGWFTFTITPFFLSREAREF